MKLTSNNKRVTNVRLSNNLTHLEYDIDGHHAVVDGDFDFFGHNAKGEWEGLRETALVRDSRCYNPDGTINSLADELPNDGIIEEVCFEARF